MSPVFLYKVPIVQVGCRDWGVGLWVRNSACWAHEVCNLRLTTGDGGFAGGFGMHVAVDMSHNLNSLKGGYIGDYIWDYYRGY